MECEIKEKLENIRKWWEGENKEPIVFCTIEKKNQERKDLNLLWKNENIKPDFDKFVKWQIQNLKGIDFLGESYPVLSHAWGSRGTPMTMAAYLGGKVVFREETVWVEKTIDNWENFNIKFNPENYWAKKSKELMEKQIEKIGKNILIHMPDFGDALTCFSLLRGIENLLFDVIERQEIILEKIKEFTEAWKEAHQYFYRIYKEKFPGDCSWLIWAPGKTYACQCDFSTMISPKLFEKFVVFELEQIKNYLDYLIWHLDGPDEIKHVDILLSLPYIKAIQVGPGAGKPPCASSLWLPIIKKIIEKGKNVIVYVNNEEELKILTSEFPKEKMAIGIGDIKFENRNQVEQLIKWIKKLN